MPYNPGVSYRGEILGQSIGQAGRDIAQMYGQGLRLAEVKKNRDKLEKADAKRAEVYIDTMYTDDPKTAEDEEQRARGALHRTPTVDAALQPSVQPYPRLLQSCSKALGLSPKRAMSAAEKLYSAGLISYPRTEAWVFSSLPVALVSCLRSTSVVLISSRPRPFVIPAGPSIPCGSATVWPSI